MVISMRKQWRSVSASEAARIANAGGFVVVGWQNAASRPGHVMFLMEGSAEDGTRDGMRCFHIGSGDPRLTTVGAIFPKLTTKVEYFVDPLTYAEWADIDSDVQPAVAGTDFSIATDLLRPTIALSPSQIDE
jgi:hypothetical protein